MLEIEKAKACNNIEIVEYVPHSVVIKTILQKSTGSVNVMSFDIGEGLRERTNTYDVLFQIIEGIAEIIINGESNVLQQGQLIIIPAHTPNYINPGKRFKMIMTVIKSGYDCKN